MLLFLEAQVVVLAVSKHLFGNLVTTKNSDFDLQSRIIITHWTPGLSPTEVLCAPTLCFLDGTMVCSSQMVSWIGFNSWLQLVGEWCISQAMLSAAHGPGFGGHYYWKGRNLSRNYPSTVVVLLEASKVFLAPLTAPEHCGWCIPYFGQSYTVTLNVITVW